MLFKKEQRLLYIRKLRKKNVFYSGIKPLRENYIFHRNMISSIAPVVGSPLLGYGDVPDVPMSLIDIFGINDQIIPYDLAHSYGINRLEKNGSLGKIYLKSFPGNQKSIYKVPYWHRYYLQAPRFFL